MGRKTMRAWYLVKKYRQIIAYGFFGMCTTLINIAAYWVFTRVFRFSIFLSIIAAWFLAVIFAYFTNRKWVFHSSSVNQKDVLREIVKFYFCRVSTGILDFLIMYIFVYTANLNDVVIKALSNIVVIIANFAASKWLIFNEK